MMITITGEEDSNLNQIMKRTMRMSRMMSRMRRMRRRSCMGKKKRKIYSPVCNLSSFLRLLDLKVKGVFAWGSFKTTQSLESMCVSVP